MKPATEGRRITYKRARPNPHIQDMLEQLYEAAKAKKSKEEAVLKEAFNSISKYPLPLHSGDECSILKGFNTKLCSFINEQLIKNSPKLPVICLDDDYENTQSHVESNSSVQQLQRPTQKSSSTPRSIPSSAGSNQSSQNQIGSSSIESNSDAFSPDVQSINTTYKPKYRSGGYAILITLLVHSKANPNKSSLTKEALIENAQKHSDESFTRPKPESFYTAWTNMSRLITKGLVLKCRSKKVEYTLTEMGKYTAAELLNDSVNRATVNDIIFNDDQNNDDIEMIEAPVTENLQLSDSNGTLIEMPAGSYDVILLIDKNETGGVSKKNVPTIAQFNKYPDLKHEYRSLKVGDFTWIARDKVNKNQELVLPYIVERKRMDDLGASIKDGRFHEQKFRLRRCSLDNVIYMVEKYGSNKHVGLPLQTLMQALANTRVQDGFKVHVTDSLTNSARFLAMLTKRLTIEYKNKHLRGCNSESNGQQLMTFEYFNKSSSKTKPLTVTETFIKILLQLKGMSVEKALAITNEFSTPRALIEAYKGCSKRDGEFLLANLKYDSLNRNVGPNISKSLYQLFSCDT